MVGGVLVLVLVVVLAVVVVDDDIVDVRGQKRETVGEGVRGGRGVTDVVLCCITSLQKYGMWSVWRRRA